MSKKYIVLAKRTCPFCVRATSLLEEKGEDVSVIYFNESQQSLLTEFKEAYQHHTVPMIFERQNKNLKFIGGHDDLVEHVR